MVEQDKFSLSNISIGLLWLFHVSGIIGIVYGNSDWFVSATPLNLSLCFILIFLNTPINKKLFFIFIACFFFGNDSRNFRGKLPTYFWKLSLR